MYLGTKYAAIPSTITPSKSCDMRRSRRGVVPQRRSLIAGVGALLFFSFPLYGTRGLVSVTQISIDEGVRYGRVRERG